MPTQIFIKEGRRGWMAHKPGHLAKASQSKADKGYSERGSCSGKVELH